MTSGDSDSFDLGIQLIDAVRRNDFETMGRLIDQKADVDTDCRGWFSTPLNTACSVKTRTARGVETQTTDGIKILIERRANVNAADKYGWTPLLVAADIQNYDAVEMLIRSKADPAVPLFTTGTLAEYSRLKIGTTPADLIKLAAETSDKARHIYDLITIKPAPPAPPVPTPAC